MWFPSQHDSHNSVWPRPTRLWCSNLQDKRSPMSSSCELFGKKSGVRRSYSGSRLPSLSADIEGRFVRSQSLYCQPGSATQSFADRDSGFLGACGSNELSLENTCDSDPDALERWRNAGLALHRMLTKTSPCKQSRSGHSRKRSKFKVEFPNSSENICGKNVRESVRTSESSGMEHLRRSTTETPCAAKGLRSRSVQDICSVHKNDKDNIDSFFKMSFRQRLLSSSPELEKMFPKMFESLTNEKNDVHNNIVCQSPRDASSIPQSNHHCMTDPGCSSRDQTSSQQSENADYKSVPRPTSLAIINTNTQNFGLSKSQNIPNPIDKSQDVLMDYRSVLNKLDSTCTSVKNCKSGNVAMNSGEIKSEVVSSDDDSGVNVNRCTIRTESIVSSKVKIPTCTESSSRSSPSTNITCSESLTVPSLSNHITTIMSNESYVAKTSTHTELDNSASVYKFHTCTESDFETCSSSSDEDVKQSSSFPSCISQQKSALIHKEDQESHRCDSSQTSVCNSYMYPCACSCAFCLPHFSAKSLKNVDFISTSETKPGFLESGSCAIKKTMLNKEYSASSNQDTSVAMGLCNTNTPGYIFNDCLFCQSANCGMCNNHIHSGKSIQSDLNKACNMNMSPPNLYQHSRWNVNSRLTFKCEDCSCGSQILNSSHLDENDVCLDAFRENSDLRNCTSLQSVKEETVSIEFPNSHYCDNGEDELDTSRQHVTCGETLEPVRWQKGYPRNLLQEDLEKASEMVVGGFGLVNANSRSHQCVSLCTCERCGANFLSRGGSGDFQSRETSGDFLSRDTSGDFRFPISRSRDFRSRERSEKYGERGDFQLRKINEGCVESEEFQSRETDLCSSVELEFRNVGSSCTLLQNASNCADTDERKSNPLTTEIHLDSDHSRLLLNPSHSADEDDTHTHNPDLQDSCQISDHSRLLLNPSHSADEDDTHTHNPDLQDSCQISKLMEKVVDNKSPHSDLLHFHPIYCCRVSESDDADCDSALSDDGYHANHCCCCSSSDSMFRGECNCRLTQGRPNDVCSRSDGRRLRRKRRKKLVHGRKTYERKGRSSSNSSEVEQTVLSDENIGVCSSDVGTVDPFSTTMLQLYFLRGQYEDYQNELNETKESQPSSTEYNKSFSVHENSLGLCESGSLELSPLKDIFLNPLSPCQPVSDFCSVPDVPSCDGETSLLHGQVADNSEKIERSGSVGSFGRTIDEIFSPFEAMIGAHGSDASNNSSESNKVADFFRAPDLDYPSSDSGDADDEFECDCEHCQLVRVSGHPDQLSAVIATSDPGSLGTDPPQISNPWETEWTFSGDNDFDVSLDDFRPLEPFLHGLQQLPQDPIELMYQNVIMQMLTVHPELLGELAPPPVSLTVIDKLEVVTASKDNTGSEMKCPICLCWFDEGEELTRLPCQHLYHPLCIQAWLVKSGTCPVCRHVLQSEL
ncbi:uncharacterized protein LOC121373356 [Gigantopelta aegis]|uniref:uncharacterized protein LOC121373356 n=1 Tax=Gigantopelta aegis TaxID=1735272 RepID=UPI001B88DD4D|nr:uncharacterized protein LOC121373356 [Gigantopelta aegis]XP_041355888.1 uncharacterized protein LOC121373356 [Gigantopelta aegis]